jgi:hypothetical protein
MIAIHASTVGCSAHCPRLHQSKNCFQRRRRHRPVMLTVTRHKGVRQ